MNASVPDMKALRRRLYGRKQAVLAMASGGCARYAFSRDVCCCMDRNGFPLLAYESENPHHHLIMTNSGMTLRFDPEENPASDSRDDVLILTGMLVLVDPGDHDAIDRYTRFFGGEIENHTRGRRRLYRFDAKRADLEVLSGERTLLPLAALIRRNPFPEKQELSLVRHTNITHRDVIAKISAAALEPAEHPAKVIGLDREGFDISVSGRIVRVHFAGEIESAEHARRLFEQMRDGLEAIS